jgi:hypothetical protein
MYSIRNIAILSAALLIGGCATADTPQPVNQRPLVVDQAMQARDWNQSEAIYPSGSFVAGPLCGLPWKSQTYRGVYWEPTYTAQPPLEVIAYEDRVTGYYPQPAWEQKIQSHMHMPAMHMPQMHWPHLFGNKNQTAAPESPSPQSQMQPATQPASPETQPASNMQ